jgi:aerotaxis receptor
VDQCERQAAESSQVLSEIHAQVSAITALNGQIAGAVEQQGVASEAIHRSIEEIHQASEQQAVHSHDSNRAAAAVSRQAEQLRQLARQFWHKRVPKNDRQR